MHRYPHLDTPPSIIDSKPLPGVYKSMIIDSTRYTFALIIYALMQVDYRDRAAAVRRIPLTFTRRESRPSDREVLTSRVIGMIVCNVSLY